MLARRDIPLSSRTTSGELYFGKNRPLVYKHFDEKGLVLYCSSFQDAGARLPRRLVPGAPHEQVLKEKLAIPSLRHTLPRCHCPFPGRRAPVCTCGGCAKPCIPSACVAARHQRLLSGKCPHHPVPQGGYTLWLELPQEVNAYVLYRQAIRHNISIAPGRRCSAPTGVFHYIRLSYGAPYSGGDRKQSAGIRATGERSFD